MFLMAIGRGSDEAGCSYTSDGELDYISAEEELSSDYDSCQSDAEWTWKTKEKKLKKLRDPTPNENRPRNKNTLKKTGKPKLSKTVQKIQELKQTKHGSEASTDKETVKNAVVKNSWCKLPNGAPSTSGEHTSIWGDKDFPQLPVIESTEGTDVLEKEVKNEVQPNATDMSSEPNSKAVEKQHSLDTATNTLPEVAVSTKAELSSEDFLPMQDSKNALPDHPESNMNNNTMATMSDEHNSKISERHNSEAGDNYCTAALEDGILFKEEYFPALEPIECNVVDTNISADSKGADRMVVRFREGDFPALDTYKSSTASFPVSTDNTFSLLNEQSTVHLVNTKTWRKPDIAVPAVKRRKPTENYFTVSREGAHQMAAKFTEEDFPVLTNSTPSNEPCKIALPAVEEWRKLTKPLPVPEVKETATKEELNPVKLMKNTVVVRRPPIAVSTDKNEINGLESKRECSWITEEIEHLVIKEENKQLPRNTFSSEQIDGSAGCGQEQESKPRERMSRWCSNDSGVISESSRTASEDELSSPNGYIIVEDVSHTKSFATAVKLPNSVKPPQVPEVNVPTAKDESQFVKVLKNLPVGSRRTSRSTSIATQYTWISNHSFPVNEARSIPVQVDAGRNSGTDLKKKKIEEKVTKEIAGIATYSLGALPSLMKQEPIISEEMNCASKTGEITPLDLKEEQSTVSVNNKFKALSVDVGESKNCADDAQESEPKEIKDRWYSTDSGVISEFSTTTSEDELLSSKERTISEVSSENGSAIVKEVEPVNAKPEPKPVIRPTPFGYRNERELNEAILRENEQDYVYEELRREVEFTRKRELERELGEKCRIETEQAINAEIESEICAMLDRLNVKDRSTLSNEFLSKLRVDCSVIVLRSFCRRLFPENIK